MKILHCEKCDRYTVIADVEITTYVTAKLQEDGSWVAYDIDLPSGHLNVAEDQEVICPDCENPYAIIDVDECPHNWQTRFDRVSRQCEICRTIQQGTVTWPTK